MLMLPTVLVSVTVVVFNNHIIRYRKIFNNYDHFKYLNGSIFVSDSSMVLIETAQSCTILGKCSIL